jgi:integrase
MASYNFAEWHKPTPWRVYHRGKSYYVKTEALAKKKVAELDNRKGAFSKRELDEYRHVQELLQGVPVLTAVRAYLDQHSSESAETVKGAIARHVATMTGCRPASVEKRAYFLGKLSARVGDKLLRSVSPSDIEAAQGTLKSDWMKNDFLKHTRILFRYAVRMKLTRNNPTEGMGDKKVTPSKVILTLADTTHLLDTCAKSHRDILPAIALQLFMGIRTSEICRLQWDAVKSGEFVDIDATVAKTHERRVIDWWPERLTQFMPEKREGGVVPLPKNYEHAKWELVKIARATKADFVFGQNCLRHSFASYAVARWQDAGRVALWMGQRDVNILFRHYRNYRTQAEGVAFFGAGV